MLRTLCLVVLFVVGVAFSVHAFDDVGIRARGLAGAYRAIALGNDAMIYNPAGMAVHKHYDLDVEYQYDFAIKRHMPGVSIVDSSTSLAAAGLRYDIGIATLTKPAMLSHFARLSVAFEAVEKVFFIGATVMYTHQPKIEGDKKINNVTGDVGLLLKPTETLSIAAVGYNLIPTYSKRVPMAFAAALAMDFGKMMGLKNNEKGGIGAMSGFSLAFDWLMTDLLNKANIDHVLHAGLEALFFEAWAVRGGYRWDKNLNTHVIACGTGFVSEGLALDLMYEQGISHLNERAIGADVKVYF